ncbi:hypothetical protein [Streptomyces sp. 2A115]|uniref:hypothetical protein n=1 Tax=Streptomyces sp. 2A115 TaxID=3457439 RepID=UPI003FD04F15
MNDTSPDRADKDRPEHGPGQQDRAERDRTERELRAALETLAGGVRAAPDAYRTARGDWLRRERRRRLVLAVLIAVVFTLATLIGLWVLNQAPSDPGVIFSGAQSAERGWLPALDRGVAAALRA